MKRLAKVASDVGESSEKIMGFSRLAKVVRSDFSSSCGTVTSVGGMSNDIGLSDIVTLSQCSVNVLRRGRVGPSRVLVGFKNVDMPALEESTGQEKFSQRLR